MFVMESRLKVSYECNGIDNQQCSAIGNSLNLAQVVRHRVRKDLTHGRLSNLDECGKVLQ